MKTITFLMLICFAKGVYGQDCKSLYYLQNNKTVEMTNYNKKGSENGKQVYSISDIKNEGSTVSSTVNVEMFDKNGKSLAKGSDKIQCTGGVLKIDMKMFIPSQHMEQIKNVEASATAAYLEYPATMKVGDKLPDGKFNMDYTNNGMAGTMEINMTDRSVDAKETVTSPAGTWEAFKITYNSKIKMKIAGIGIPVNAEVTEWYVPGFGIVKTQSKYGSTLITAIH